MTTRVCESNKSNVQLPVESYDKRELSESSQENVVMPTLSIVSTSSSEQLSEQQTTQACQRLSTLPQQKTDPHPPGFRAQTRRAVADKQKKILKSGYKTM